ncbi:MAG: hypothetical protein LBF59_10285 [Prevotellaceae bacterium]|nr:hypothetical protein [Prevotellaceae bacterium]
MSTGCGRSSGRFRQCQRGADARREGFDNVSGLRTLVGKISTMSTGCGRSSGRLRQCHGLLTLVGKSLRQYRSSVSTQMTQI